MLGQKSSLNGTIETVKMKVARSKGGENNCGIPPSTMLFTKAAKRDDVAAPMYLRKMCCRCQKSSCRNIDYIDATPASLYKYGSFLRPMIIHHSTSKP